MFKNIFLGVATASANDGAFDAASTHIYTVTNVTLRHH